MKSLSLLVSMLLLVPSAMGTVEYDVTDLDNHPMIKEAEESSVTCPADIDPEAHWMKKFLELIKDKLPNTAVTWEALLPNLRHLADLETKGWLAAIAKGEKKASDLVWPDPDLKPWIIPTYMPLVTPPQPEPVIVLEQIYNGNKRFKEVVGKQVRKRRDVNGQEVEEEVYPKQRAFHVDPSHFSDDLPYLGEQPEHEIHEHELDDNGQVIGRKKRETADGLVTWPAPGTLFTVKRLCVKAHANGTIIFPGET